MKAYILVGQVWTLTFALFFIKRYVVKAERLSEADL